MNKNMPMNETIKIKLQNLWFYYNDHPILEDINLEIPQNTITVVTGPSGQGKSTFLMTLNRLWESIEGTRIKGRIDIKFGSNFQNIYDKRQSMPDLRRQVGMVFQVPNPLPMSVYNNIAFPLKLKGEKNKKLVTFMVEEALKRSFLWNEVKDRLNEDARVLSGGQQQRLCIARALILNPQVLLLDEPTSSLDDKAGRVIEDLLFELKKECTIILVSHYLEQVKRIADSGMVLSDRQMKRHW